MSPEYWNRRELRVYMPLDTGDALPSMTTRQEIGSWYEEAVLYIGTAPLLNPSMSFYGNSARSCYHPKHHGGHANPSNEKDRDACVLEGGQSSRGASN